VRAVAVIDGEHYPPVVRDALAELPYDFAAAFVAGGSEKLRGDDDYGLPVLDDLEAALEQYEPGVVVDLSDEPVLGPRERFRLASRVLARGLPYVGPGFSLEPPPLEPFPLPSLAVIGTGKRMGKTAVAGYAARLLAEDRDVVVVSMGRGGPPEPELAKVRPAVEDLIELSRAGRHAASDYLETAALSGVVTIGCRRCGGGLAGATAVSNVAAGAKLAIEQSPELVIFDGSGAAIPPVETGKTLLVAGAHQPPEIVVGYLNAYRILVSDLVVLTMAEEGSRQEDLKAAIGDVRPDVPVVASVLRPRPVSPIGGRRLAYFTTAPEEAHEVLAEHLRTEHDSEVVGISGNLARRDALREDLDRLEAEVYLVEIKAAAIDVVAEEAERRGVELVFADNEVRPLPGEPDLDAELQRLVE
jgi:cyclic 2,3-diphosphoglycerate synthetase